MKPSLPFMTVPGTTDMMVRAADQFDAVRLAANGGVFGAGLTAMTVTSAPPERLLVDLSVIPALRGISVESGWMRIGALTTLEHLRQDAAVALHLPELVGLLPFVASVQVRNRGTLGGNIAWRNGDLVPVLTARGARLCGPALDVAIEDYKGGLIGEIVVPVSGDVGMAEKIGHRAAFSPSLVTVAATVGVAWGAVSKHAASPLAAASRCCGWLVRKHLLPALPPLRSTGRTCVRGSWTRPGTVIVAAWPLACLPICWRRSLHDPSCVWCGFSFFFFLSDLSPAGCLHAVVARSAVPHARILSVDTQAAKAVAGVVAVNDGERPARQTSTSACAWRTSLSFCGDYFRAVGDPVAVVAATDCGGGKAGRVSDFRCDGTSSSRRIGGGGATRGRSPRCMLQVICFIRHIMREATSKRHSRNASISSRTNIPRSIRRQPSLRPKARWRCPQDGGMTVHAPGHWAEMERQEIAAILALPPDKVRVVGSPAGGSFGGKDQLHAQPLRRAVGAGDGTARAAALVS